MSPEHWRKAVSEPWERRPPVTNNVTSDTRNMREDTNNIFREVVSKAVAMPVLVSVAAIVYMQMFRQQYNNRREP